MHVGVMFVNAETGQGGSLQFSYDEAFNSSDVTNIRNEQIEANSPISEALYEGLCLFRKSQGPCYSNSGSGRQDMTRVERVRSGIPSISPA